MFKKIITISLTLGLLLGITISQVSVVQNPVIEVQAKDKIKLNVTSKTLYKGKSLTLKVSGTNKKVTWSSDKTSVATVTSKGKVTAKKVGIAYIYAKVSGKTLKCKITVKNQKIVVIDAGHQAKGNNAKEPIGPGAKEKKAKVTTGTTGKWTKKKESEINLAVAKKLQTELVKRGYKVIMVRTKQNVNISNKQRADIANKAKADVFIRLHCDGSSNPKISGAHTIAPTSKNKYVSKNVKTSSQKLAKSIMNSFCKNTKAKNRSVSYRDDMSGINWCKVPVTIIEMGFMSNKQEDKKLATSAYQTKCAIGIANGIDNYFKK